MKKTLIFIALVILLGCETTGDPKQGGLFGWSENKAVQRQDGLKNSLSQEEQELRNEQAASAKLKADRDRMLAEREKQRIMISTLDSDLNSISRQIKAAENKRAGKTADIKAAEDQLAGLQAEIASIKNNRTLPIQEKQERIDSLKQDIDKLLILMSTL